MKLLSLLMWVGQFGFSVIFPLVFFLYLAVRLQAKFGLGMWILILFGILGTMTSVSAAKSCLRSLRKAAEDASDEKQLPLSFNDHK